MFYYLNVNLQGQRVKPVLPLQLLCKLTQRSSFLISWPVISFSQYHDSNNQCIQKRRPYLVVDATTRILRLCHALMTKEQL